MVAGQWEPPSIVHLMGTDDLGRDIFAGIIHGINVSLYIGCVAVLVSLIVGIPIGALSGYVGGKTDELLMRIVELFQVLPSFVLAIVFVTFFGASLNNVILVIGLVSWPVPARITRAQFLSLKEKDFVVAARAIGTSTSSIIFFEILPNAISPVVVNATIKIAHSILLESSLSFLGFSDPEVMSLGRMLANAQPFLVRAPWMCVFPGIFLLLITLSVNLLGDLLNEVINPRLRPRE